VQLWKKKDASSVGTRPLNHLQTNLDIMQFMSQILLLTVTIRMVDTNWERATGWIWMCWNHRAAYKTRCDVDWMMAPSGVAWDGRERESFNNVVAATEFKVTVCMCCRLSHWQRGPHVLLLLSLHSECWKYVQPEAIQIIQAAVLGKISLDSWTNGLRRGRKRIYSSPLDLKWHWVHSVSYPNITIVFFYYF